MAEVVPFRDFSEHQDKYRAWSVLPARSLKPPECHPRGASPLSAWLGQAGVPSQTGRTAKVTRSGKVAQR
ncbi:hypothetical protein AAFF_G00255070 [Aldrovandia affinis]|uniref:Uncharacterized protein n=1 Tax=Aldrovandia affinis TaxID=143900 RepID=A0AAD7W3L8_9TELE|nr:hypothetical protein AAFF_G00255070 [Aldrovandia affinis]